MSCCRCCTTTGACCNDGVCTEETCADCEDAGGVFQGVGTECSGEDSDECPCDPPADPSLCEKCDGVSSVSYCPEERPNCCDGTCQADPCPDPCETDEDCPEGELCCDGVCQEEPCEWCGGGWIVELEDVQGDPTPEGQACLDSDPTLALWYAGTPTPECEECYNNPGSCGCNCDEIFGGATVFPDCVQASPFACFAYSDQMFRCAAEARAWADQFDVAEVDIFPTGDEHLIGEDDCFPLGPCDEEGNPIP